MKKKFYKKSPQCKWHFELKKIYFYRNMIDDNYDEWAIN